MRYADSITSILNRIIDIYEVNADTMSHKRKLLLHKMAWLSELLLIGGTIAYMLVGILHYVNPIYGYFRMHEFKALFPLYIAFIDEKTAYGFIGLLLIQSIEMIAGLVASACADFAFVMVVINAWVFSTVFKDNMDEFNQILRKNKVDMQLANTKLRNIVDVYYDVWM